MSPGGERAFEGGERVSFEASSYCCTTYTQEGHDIDCRRERAYEFDCTDLGY
ncbi:uncharacterized protein PHALS_00024 [Plasmopara halstedii]|uniref:Uncharacterized protein n=1 Tax=Plasmopara halstedii TaxID=4781 RepID=A0A0P1A6K5_PLAHL|nr:uncharacterized protein PHALS_00024 [Plasmopara halstedii]CEG35687.1 hypothetical protein PHALS_00024 [Plasmopara halstedii]|eukprot:XP_024572056.1 hypothetical protein PHALS_00024 [Plasmopara halstedii]